MMNSIIVASLWLVFGIAMIPVMMMSVAVAFYLASTVEMLWIWVRRQWLLRRVSPKFWGLIEKMSRPGWRRAGGDWTVTSDVYDVTVSSSGPNRQAKVWVGSHDATYLFSAFELEEINEKIRLVYLGLLRQADAFSKKADKKNRQPAEQIAVLVGK